MTTRCVGHAVSHGAMTERGCDAQGWWDVAGARSRPTPRPTTTIQESAAARNALRRHATYAM